MDNSKKQKMTLESFKKKNQKLKNKSKLFEFQNEIIELITDGYSQESICEFLQENGVKTNQPSVSRFVKKITKIEEPKKEDLKKEDLKTNTSLNEMKQIKEENTQEPVQKKSLLKTSNVKTFEIIEPDYSKFEY
jgi:arginine repressor